MSKSPIVARGLTKQVATALKHFPFVTITGPRQSGKTTICHIVASDYTYINFEIEKYRLLAQNDPEEFIKKYPHKVILDEVQNVPELLPHLMVHTDAEGKNGAYILSGSQNLLLMESITQSLAGRVAILTLLPFALEELQPYLLAKQIEWKALAFRGMFPRLYKEKKLQPNLFYQSYIKTYINKDVTKLAEIHNLNLFGKFIKLLANRVGSVLNYSSIANELDVDRKTVQKWISYLETSFIVYLLPSFHANFDKRVLKANKLYFTDTGLLCNLLRIKNAAEIDSHPYKGNIFENFFIIEKLKRQLHRGLDADFYYFQDSNKNEIDLIIEGSQSLELYEIKTSTTPKIEFAKELKKMMPLAEAKGYKVRAHVVYTGTDSYTQNKIKFSTWRDLLLEKF
jgi:uncharacterized protein